VAAHVFTQNKGHFQDSPREDLGPSAGSGTGLSTIGTGQFDHGLVRP